MKKKITHYSIIAFAVAILWIAIWTIASNTTISFQIPHTIINTIWWSSGSHATVSYDKKWQPWLFILSTWIKPVNVTLNLSWIESLHCSGQLVWTYTNPNWFQNVVFPIDNDTLSDFTTKTDSFHGYWNLSMSGWLYTNCSGYNSDLVFWYINYKYSWHNNLKIWAWVKTWEDWKIANFLGKEDEWQLRVIQWEELTLQWIIYDSVSSKWLVTPWNWKYASGSLEFTGDNVSFQSWVSLASWTDIEVILKTNWDYTWIISWDIEWWYVTWNFRSGHEWSYIMLSEIRTWITLTSWYGIKNIDYILSTWWQSQWNKFIKHYTIEYTWYWGEPWNNEWTWIDCSFEPWSVPEIPQNWTSTINLICTWFKGIVTRHTLASRESWVKYSNPWLWTVSLESTETWGDTTIFTLKFAANEIIWTGRILITGDVIHDVSWNYNKPTERSPILTVTWSDTPWWGSQSDSWSVECAWGIWFTWIVSNWESATIALTCTGTSGAIITNIITWSSVWDGDSSLWTISDWTRDSSSSHGQDSQRIANYTFTFTGWTWNGEVKLILREWTVCNNNWACNTWEELKSEPLAVKNDNGGNGGEDPEPIDPPVCRPWNSWEVYEFSGSVDVTCTGSDGTKVVVSTGDAEPSCDSLSGSETWTWTFTETTILNAISCISDWSGSEVVTYIYKPKDNWWNGSWWSSWTSLPVITITWPSTWRATSKTVSATATNNPTTFQYTIVTSNTECSGDTLSYSDYTSGSGLTFTAESDSWKYVCFKAENTSWTVYKKSDIIDKIDRTEPTFTFSNWTWNECSPWILSITYANDTGAWLANNGAYKFGNGNWWTTTSYSITAQQPWTITVTGYVRDALWNQTVKTATYTFNNVAPTANNFSTWNIWKTAKSITLAQFISASNASEWSCGTSALNFSGVKTNWTKGSCSISSNTLTYTPNTNKTGSDTCVITIKDNENSTVDVSVTFNWIDTTDHWGNDTPGWLTNWLNIELRWIWNNSDEYTSDIELKIIWHWWADTRKILFTTNNTCPTSWNQYYTFQRYGIADNYNGNTSISSFVIPTGYEWYYVCVYWDNWSQYGIARTNYPIRFIHTNTWHTWFYYISPASWDIVRPWRITLRWHQSWSWNQYDYKWEIATRSNFANSSIVRSWWRSNTNTVSTTIDETWTYYRRVYEYIWDTWYILSWVRFYIAETWDNWIYGCDSINNTWNLSGLTANQKLWWIVFVDSLVETYQDSPQKLDNFLRTFRHVLKDKYDRYCKLIYEADNNTERQEYKEAKDAVQFIYWVIWNRLDDLDLDSYEVYIAPNGKQYRVEYDRSRSAYTSPDFVYTKYFPTREIFTSHIDINNPAVWKWWLKWNVVTAYNGKQYTIYQTTDGRWTSDNFIYKKYFKNKDEIIDHILVNNTLSNWNHELDTSFDPITYTAPNGKPYEIFKTSKDWINGNMYSSYEFASAKYFPTLEAAKKHIDQNNPKK